MEDKSFKFFKMLVAHSEVHAKTIPRGTVVIVQMLVQTPFKITGETDVVEFVPPVKGVNTPGDDSHIAGKDLDISQLHPGLFFQCTG